MRTLKFKATIKNIFDKMKTIYVIAFLLGMILIFGASYVSGHEVLSQILFTLGVTFLAFGSIQGFLEVFAQKQFFVEFTKTLLWKEDLGSILDEEVLKTFLKKSLIALLGNEKLGEGYYNYLQKNVLKYRETGFWSVVQVTCNLVLDKEKSKNKWDELKYKNENMGKYGLDEKTINLIHASIGELYRVFNASFSLNTKRAEWNWKNILESIETELKKLERHSENDSLIQELEIAYETLEKIKRSIRQNKYYIFIVHRDTSATAITENILSHLNPVISSLYSTNLEDLFLSIEKKLNRRLSDEEITKIRKYVLDTYFKVTEISINGYSPENLGKNNHWEIYLPSIGTNIEVYEFDLPEEMESLTLFVSKIIPWYFEDVIYENFLPVPTETFLFEFSLEGGETDDSNEECGNIYGPYLFHYILSDNKALIDVDLDSHKAILRVDGWCLPPSPVLVRWYYTECPNSSTKS